jgi:hypothetical protein
MVTTDAVATWTGAPLLRPSLVTMAVKLPAVVGGIENATVREVLVAAVTVPTAPWLNVTVFLAAVGSKPEPLIVRWGALKARRAVLAVTTGATANT